MEISYQAAVWVNSSKFSVIIEVAILPDMWLNAKLGVIYKNNLNYASETRCSSESKTHKMRITVADVKGLN